MDSTRTYEPGTSSQSDTGRSPETPAATAGEYPAGSLRASLAYEPVELKFGTSGRRGFVADLTQLEITINVTAELEYLKSLSASEGGIKAGDEFFYARDLRPSSSEYVAEEKGRGEIAQAVQKAVSDAGLIPVNLGEIPTPALTSHAIQRKLGSIMVTGSHIPFNRNGYKTNCALGELLKKDEEPIGKHVAAVRDRLYRQSAADSPFDSQGRFKSGHQELGAATNVAATEYLRRYADFYSGKDLRGKRVVVYQHSAVGRDMLVEALQQFGADVIPAGRSETFVPIDTENIDDTQLALIQKLADEASAAHGPVDAVVSLDGDSDRPLVLGVENGAVRFFGGDLLGMVVAEYLGADAVVVPISCNDAIDRGNLKARLEPKTKIGSPFVIAGMEKAIAKGKKAVCGWEANGGFLVGSSIEKDGNTLSPLPTRDAFLPILSILFAAKDAGVSIPQLFDRLPKRYSKAALLKDFPRPISQKIVGAYSPSNSAIQEVKFDGGSVTAIDAAHDPVALTAGESSSLLGVREKLSTFFTPDHGFGTIERINYIDGVRIYFDNGDVAHIRPSGNADELRIYAVADSQKRAEEIAALGVAEPDGILRRLAKSV